MNKPEVIYITHIEHISKTGTEHPVKGKSLLLEHLGKLANRRSRRPFLSPARLLVVPVLLPPEHEVAEGADGDETADRQRRRAVALQRARRV